MKNPDDDRTKTKQDWSIALAHRQRQLMNTCKERDEALDQVKALQDEVSRLEAELQAAREDDAEDGGPYGVICEIIVGNQISSDEGVLTSNPAYFSAVGLEAKDAETLCDRLNLERDRRIKAERGRDALRALLSDLQKDKRDAAHFQECLKAEETAHRLCFRKMKDLEEQARKGLLSTGPAQILPSGLQVTPVSDGPARDKALAKVADIEAMLGEIKDYCSAAHRAVSGLRDTIEQGGAK